MDLKDEACLNCPGIAVLRDGARRRYFTTLHRAHGVKKPARDWTPRPARGSAKSRTRVLVPAYQTLTEREGPCADVHRRRGLAVKLRQIAVRSCLHGPCAASIHEPAANHGSRIMYQSDITQFISQLKEKNPKLEAEQRQGRALLWDKQPIDLDERKHVQDSRVQQTAYVYYQNF
jgi:hypothetical protein